MQIFISDIHLDESRPDLTAFFLAFLADLSSKQPASLFLLGDIFEVWVGDDEQSPLQLEVAEALKKLADKGCQIHLMHGNRDFLMGPAFAAQCGGHLVQDPLLSHIAGQVTLLLHGDSLCTDDTKYQQFRKLTRDPSWQQTVLQRPLQDRKMLAMQLRQMSEAGNAQKNTAIMDVNPAAVSRLLEEHQCQRMIHGHTHRPAHHIFTMANGLRCERIVLGDWGEEMVYLKTAGTELELIRRSRNGLERRINPVDHYETAGQSLQP